VVLCAVAAAVVIAILALVLARQTSPRLIRASHRQPDLSVKWHIGPTLRALRANFAVLRRPPTVADLAAAAMFTSTTPPEYVRVIGRVDGTRVYLVVNSIFRHRTWGPVVAHQVTVAGGPGGAVSGFNYTRGNYLIFPQTAGGFNGQPSAYFGVVPDGVRTVRWQFACISGSHVSQTGCELPSSRVVNVPVHGNLAVLQTDQPITGNGKSYAGVTRVTWFGAAGMSKVFTNPNTAVPIPGAPVWTG
jgi:hypothetical protein